jgi:hypothetical protein
VCVCVRVCMCGCACATLQARCPHLLWRCYALLLIELCGLLWLYLQAQTFLEGLMLQHQRGAEPEIVCLSQVLQYTGSDGDRGNTLGHGFHEAVQRTGLTVPLHLVTATAQEWADLPCEGLGPSSILIRSYSQQANLGQENQDFEANLGYKVRSNHCFPNPHQPKK